MQKIPLIKWQKRKAPDICFRFPSFHFPLYNILYHLSIKDITLYIIIYIFNNKKITVPETAGCSHQVQSIFSVFFSLISICFQLS